LCQEGLIGGGAGDGEGCDEGGEGAALAGDAGLHGGVAREGGEACPGGAEGGEGFGVVAGIVVFDEGLDALRAGDGGELAEEGLGVGEGFHTLRVSHM
jgi:hypothetical protein